MNIDEILTRKILPREIMGKVKKWIDDPEMLLFSGSRQTGKSSLMYSVIQELVRGKKAPARDIFFFDAENINDAEMLSKGPDEIISHVRPGKEGRKYLFIDEIHYISGIDRTIKYLVDHYGSRLKIFASGSSSLEINKKLKESMAGRKIVFNIFPLSFGEYLSFTGRTEAAEIYEKNASLSPARNLSSENRRLLRVAFEEYCIYGGYPRAALERDRQKKTVILENVHNSYIRKDISAFFDAEESVKYNNFLRYAAINSGKVFNYESVSRDLGITRKKIEKYLSILENTYIAARVRPFSGNKTSEIIKMPKIYFIDNGMRNRLLNNFERPSDRTDGGALLETALFRTLFRYAEKTDMIKFWRTKTGNEVDFVIDAPKMLAFEGKSNPGGFSAKKYSDFIEKYRPKKFFIVNWTREEAAKGVIYKEISLL